MSAGLSDRDAERQLMQMIDFIKLEAKEKAEEIRTQANQDYEMERLMREQQAKTRLQSRFSQLEAERITMRRVAMSKELGKLRTDKLEQQSAMLQELVSDVKSQLQHFSTQNADQYRQLLAALMAQGALTVVGTAGGAHSVRVRCRAQDVETVQSLAADAARSATEQFAAAAQKDAEARAATRQTVLKARLPAAPGGQPALPALPKLSISFVVDSSRHLDDSCGGGVVVSSKDGLIVADNTLVKRLHIAAAGLQPVLSRVLFPSAAAAAAAPSSQSTRAATSDEDLLGM